MAGADDSDAYPRDVGTGLASEDDADEADAATVGSMVDLPNARDFVVDGFALSVDWTTDTLTVTSGKARIHQPTATGVNGQVRQHVTYTAETSADRTVSVPATGQHDLFVTFDPAGTSAPNVSVLATGTTPGLPSLQVGSVDADAQTVTELNRAPDGVFDTLTATDSLTDPAGTVHTGELADLADLPVNTLGTTTERITTFGEAGQTTTPSGATTLTDGRLVGGSETSTAGVSVYTGGGTSAREMEFRAEKDLNRIKVISHATYNATLREADGTVIASATAPEPKRPWSFDFPDIDLQAGNTYRLTGAGGSHILQSSLPVSSSTVTLLGPDTNHTSFTSVQGFTKPGGDATVSFNSAYDGPLVAVDAVHEPETQVTFDLLNPADGSVLVSGVTPGEDLRNRPELDGVRDVDVRVVIAQTAGATDDTPAVSALDLTFAGEGHPDLGAVVRDAAGVEHTGELADLADIPAPTPNEAFSQSVTTDTTLTQPVETVLVDASTAPVTVTLPAPSADVLVNVKRTDSSANTVTVATPGTETIDGAADLPIAAQYDSYTLVSDGANYYVI